MKTLVIGALILGSLAFGAEGKKSSPSPAASVSPSPTVPPPQIIKETPKKKHSSNVDKVEKILGGCDANKKKCVRKLKELRATITDPKVLKHIDDVLKTL